MESKSYKRIENGDLVRVIHRPNNTFGIVVSTSASNNYPSKHAENVLKSYSWNHYVLFKDFVEGPFLSSELVKIN